MVDLNEPYAVAIHEAAHAVACEIIGGCVHHIAIAESGRRGVVVPIGEKPGVDAYSTAAYDVQFSLAGPIGAAKHLGVPLNMYAGANAGDLSQVVIAIEVFHRLTDCAGFNGVHLESTFFKVQYVTTVDLVNENWRAIKQAADELMGFPLMTGARVREILKSHQPRLSITPPKFGMELFTPWPVPLAC